MQGTHDGGCQGTQQALVTRRHTLALPSRAIHFDMQPRLCYNHTPAIMWAVFILARFTPENRTLQMATRTAAPRGQPIALRTAAQDETGGELTFELATDARSDSFRKYHIWTIGCQMNVADSNHVAAELEKIGYGPTDQLDDADVVVINTCVVRQAAEEKGQGKVGSLKPWKQARPDRAIALMGCMVGVKPSPQLLAAYPHVDVFMPPSEASPLVNFLRQAEIDAEMAAIEREQMEQRFRMQDAVQPVGSAQSIKHLALSGTAPVAAFVPIVYGCSHACTFCIIPFRRGVERSRPVNEIVNEIRGLVAQGVREVTLLGQIVDRYGYDWRADGAGRGNSATVTAHQGADEGGFDLADLLRAVHEIDGLWRIRFLTSHPNYMTDRILQAVDDLPKVCEHIEVPIQAGDDDVLQTMRRGYSRDEYLLLIERIRAILRREQMVRTAPRGNESIIERGKLRLDETRHECSWDGERLVLTVTEFMLVLALAARPGHIKTRDALMAAAYGDTVGVDDRTIDSHIKRLRKKFREIDPQFNRIETLYGAGYRYRED